MKYSNKLNFFYPSLTVPRILLILLAGIMMGSCSQESNEIIPPNIIYILADDLGYGDISAFNPYGKIRTPHIDRLANSGMIFTDAHSSSSVCTPTRYGLLTGRYNWRTTLKSGVLTGKSKALIPKSRTTVASLLQDHGYHTSFIGKWHLGWNWALFNPTEFGGEGWNPEDFGNLDFNRKVLHTPNDLGFTYAYGHSGSLDMAPYVYVENGLPTSTPTYTTVDTGEYTWWRKGPTAPDFIHDDVTPNFFRRARKMIKEQAAADQPFFLYLALPSPHTPILPTAEWQGRSKLNPYADFVLMIDDYMGQLMQEVRDAGIEKNTLIIFTSDNGCSPEANFELLKMHGHHPSGPFRGHKADIYEGGHRVPFIASWPGLTKPGLTNKTPICLTDLTATVADILNYKLKENEGEDSFSLIPLFNHQNEEYTREAVIHHSINGSFAIRKGDWKLIMCPGSGGWSYPRPNDTLALAELPPYQLYNLKNDPGERKNLFQKDHEVAVELKAFLERSIIEGRTTPGIPQENEIGPNQWTQIEFTSILN